MSSALEALEEEFEFELWLREVSPHLYRACSNCGRMAKEHPDVEDSECPEGWYTDPRIDRRSS